MKKIFTYMLAGVSLLLFSRCDSLDLEPTSSIADSNYWKSEAHFSAFNAGVHALFRERSYTFFVLGEPRSNVYSGTDSFGGEANQGNARLPLNNLNQENPGISNFGDLYKVINQLNLMIAKTNETTILSDESKREYLGEAYGMRAFLYFQLLRSWGSVIIYTDYTSGNMLDLSKLAKPASSEAEVMALIKADIKASEDAFNENYAFKNGRKYWSLPATKMLKAEVYLWSGKQMNGGEADYRIAKAAAEDVKKADVELIGDFKKIFAYDNKLNKEIIFAIHNGKDEYNLWGDSWRANMIPQQLYIPNFCNAQGVSFKELPEAQLNGMIRFQLQHDLFHKLYRDDDARRNACLTSVYQKKENGVIEYVSCYAFKFQGILLDGASQRSFLEDNPIYRYADCLLLLAEAKALLNEDPSAEINEVRKRAYGETYFNDHPELAYPNDNAATVIDPVIGNIDLYGANKYIKPDNAGALHAILKERLRELIFEGKHWYDLRLLGWEYVKEYSTLTREDQQVWPINQNVLTDNPALEQNPGYKQK